MNELINRLERYSEQCLTERLDADFAKAVVAAAAIIKSQHKLIMLLFSLLDKHAENNISKWRKEYGIH